MGKDVIVACDFSSAQQTFDFLDKFTEEKPFVKIGMELFYAEGPSIVKEIKKEVIRFSLTLSFTISLIPLKNLWLFFQNLMLI